MISRAWTGRAVEKEIEHQVENRVEVFDNADFDVKSLVPYQARWAQQFWALLWRAWHSVVKEPLVVRIRIMEALVRAVQCPTVISWTCNRVCIVFSFSSSPLWSASCTSGRTTTRPAPPASWAPYSGWSSTTHSRTTQSCST